MTLLRLVRWELFKLSRQRASYVGFVLTLGFLIVMLIGFEMSSWKTLRRYQGLPFDPMALINGPFFAHFSLQIGAFAVLPLLAATLGGGQLAGEARDGTLRALLVRPPGRGVVFASKAIATWIWLQLQVLFMVGLALLIGAIAFGGGDLLVYIWEFRERGLWLVAPGDWWLLFVTVSLGAGATLFVIAAVALMVSAFTDSPVVAQVGALGAFFISAVMQRLPDQVLAPEVKDALPTRHMNVWHELYRLWDPAGSLNTARLVEDVVWCGGFVVVALGVGAWWFRRKDVVA